MESPLLGLILDSSVIITAERKRQTVEEFLTSVGRTFGEVEIAISAVTLAELVHGVARANTPDIRRVRRAFLDDLKKHVPVHPVTDATAETGRTAIGRPIPLWNRPAIEVGPAVRALLRCSTWRHAASSVAARRLAISLFTRRILWAAFLRIAGVHWAFLRSGFATAVGSALFPGRGPVPAWNAAQRFLSAAACGVDLCCAALPPLAAQRLRCASAMRARPSSLMCLERVVRLLVSPNCPRNAAARSSTCLRWGRGWSASSSFNGRLWLDKLRCG